MKFTIHKPVATKDPTVTVDAGLPVGRHVFRLVVENEHGTQSKPADATIMVTDTVPNSPLTHNPTPIFRPFS